jgi:hypothetical protein
VSAKFDGSVGFVPAMPLEKPAVTGFILNDGKVYAIYLADWHPQHQEPYVDVILGSFEDRAHRVSG